MTDIFENVDPPREVEFRDGTRVVAAYLANMLAGIDTYRYTFDQAVDIANRRLEADFLNAQQDRALAAHFRERR